MRLLLVLAALLLVSDLASAQDNVFSPGNRLRLEAPRHFEGRLDGYIRSFTHEGVGFEDSASGRDYLIPMRDIHYLAAFRGNDRRYVMKRRAAWMGFVGVAVGAVTGPAVAAGLGENNLLGTAALAAVGGGLIGVSTGLLTGSRHSGEVWREYRFLRQGNRAGAQPAGGVSLPDGRDLR